MSTNEPATAPVIDPLARVEDGAVIGEGAVIGPFCVIGPDAVIGPGCKLMSHVNVAGRTTLGARTTVYPFVSLGTAPQSLAYRGEPTTLEIGDDCTLREGVTMNVGTVGGGGVTRVGARGYFMNNAHVGHDCQVGNDVIFATSATLGGHCHIGDQVFIGGLSAVHQFTRVGRQAMIGGVCGVRGDIIPFGLVNGQYAALEGLNIVGLRRRQFSRERIRLMNAFYRSLFLGQGVFSERLARAREQAGEDPAIAEILDFIDGGQNRSLCLPEIASAK